MYFKLFLIVLAIGHVKPDEITLHGSEKSLPLSKKLEFTIDRTLGNGSTSRVYEVTLADNNQKYALKVAHSDNYGKYIFNEWLAALKLINSGIYPDGLIKIIGYGNVTIDKNSRVGILIEYIQGQNLRETGFSTPNTTIEEILSVGLDVVKCLEELHKNGIVHGDIKPGNLLRKTNAINLFNVVLSDLGFAQFEESSLPRKICGSLEYMIPNIHLLEDASPNSDLRSLVYMLVEPIFPQGKLPWSGTCAEIRKAYVKQIERKAAVTDSIPEMEDKTLYWKLKQEKEAFENNLANYAWLGEGLTRVLQTILNCINKNATIGPDGYKAIRDAFVDEIENEGSDDNDVEMQ